MSRDLRALVVGALSLIAAGAAQAGLDPCAPAGSACTSSSAACSSACGSPTGSATCATADRIAQDPVAAFTRLAPRTGATPAERGLVDLEALLAPIRELFHVPGLGAALIRDGELAALGTTGIRSVTSNAPLELDDAMHLGSCGKAITATVAAILVEEQRLTWSTTIGERYPELEPTTHSGFRDVTLRDLLAHRGGFGARSAVFDQAIAAFDGPMTAQRAALVRYAVADVPAYAPGTTFTYSDVGYSVAGALLGRATGRSWETLVVEELATPLGLETLGFGAPGAEDPRGAAHGHVVTSTGLVALGVGPGEDLANPAIGPAGTVHMSLSDWAAFARLHLRGARGEATPLLSADGFAALHENVAGQGYGLGWFLTENRWGEGRALTHTGSCGAWSAVVWILPDANAAILATSNVGGGSGYRALQLAVDRIGAEYLTTAAKAEGS